MDVEDVKRRNIHGNHSGVAGVIEALLLVALVAVVISTIQVIYIPEIMEQKEAAHMDEVENQFSHLKSIIDLQSSIQTHDPISTSVTLGSAELPYFVTARAFGRLSVEESDDNYVKISNSNKEIDLSTIEFQSYNTYYLNQNYILEGGGVILSQDDGGKAMKIHPPITFEREDDTIFLNWTIHNFSVTGGKDSAEGYKSSYIRTQYDSNSNNSFVNSNISIYSPYVEAWNQSLNWLSDPLDCENLTIVKNETCIKIETIGSTTLNIWIDVVNINVQIGIGTIMQYSDDE